MYSKEQASKLTSQFWTNFGQYMKSVPSPSGQSVNWINYKTGIKNIHFKMDANNSQASIAIEIAHPQEEEREHYYDKFLSLKNILSSTTEFHWDWNKKTKINHQIVSRISLRLDNVNILNQADWPAIISFLKPRIIALDEFWDLVKDGF